MPSDAEIFEDQVIQERMKEWLDTWACPAPMHQPVCPPRYGRQPSDAQPPKEMGPVQEGSGWRSRKPLF